MYRVTDHIYRAPKVAYADHTIQYKNFQCDSFHFTGLRGKIAHPESWRWTATAARVWEGKPELGFSVIQAVWVAPLHHSTLLRQLG